MTAAAARRELEDLRSAINHHRPEGLCSEFVSVVLPEKSASRERLAYPLGSRAADLGGMASRADHAR